MHELGVVFYVVDAVKEVAQRNNVSHVHSVTIELGTVSGVVESYLVDCWNWAASKHPVLEGCTMKIESVQAITHCEDCKSDYDTLKYGRTCPYCNSENTFLLQGNEFFIRDIEAT